MNKRQVYLAMVLTILACGFSRADESNHVDWHESDSGHSNTVLPGETRTIYGPHHELSGGHDGHYFAETGDSHHFAWFGVTPATPGTITIRYDFRSQGGFANVITADQKARAIDALNAWSAGTNGKLQFIQDVTAAAAGIINIGTGDLAALGGTSAPGGVLGLGGASFNHAGGHLITSGVAWQDFAENWDTTIGNGNPTGTFDYFTVAAQEIGHAFGLGHTSGALDIMNGSYTGEKTGYSSVDNAHIQTIYGFNAIPEPATASILAIAGVALATTRRRRR